MKYNELCKKCEKECKQSLWAVIIDCPYQRKNKHKKARWLWYPYIPIGKVTLIHGESGDGSVSFIDTIDVTADHLVGAFGSPRDRETKQAVASRELLDMCDTIHGAEDSAIIYSITETAKANDLKLYEYLKHLLPWSDKLPAECRKQYTES